MKTIQPNEILSPLYNTENVRINVQRNRIVKKVVSRNRDEFPSIQQKVLKQTRLTNVIDAKETSIALKSRLNADLILRLRQRLHRDLQDTMNFAGELHSVKQLYKFCEINSVSGFLKKNRYLIPLLREIPEKIYSYFGKDQKLALKISFESDSPQSSELWILILTELSVNEAFPILESFDKEWWLENLDRTDCKLNISLEYI